MSDAIRRKYVCCQEEKEVVSACDGNCLDWILGCETCFLRTWLDAYFDVLLSGLIREYMVRV